MTDPEGQVRRVTFDADGRPLTDTVAVGTPLSRTTHFERDPATGEVEEVTDPFGRVTTIGYDARSNIISVTERAGTAAERVSRAAYGGPFNQVSSTTDPLQNVTRYGYDSAGNRTSVTDPEDRAWRTTYNPAGQPSSIVDPLQNATVLTYHRGDLVAAADPLGRTTRFFVDTLGRRVVTTDPVGAASTVSYDEDSRPVTVTDPLGNSTTFGYDGNGRLIRVRDARANETTYAYDAMDRLESITDPLGATTQYGYDHIGRPTSVTDRRDKLTLATYDVLGRIGAIRYGVAGSTQESTATYTYDAFDRVTRLDDSTGGSMSWSYDVYDRMVAATGPNGTVEYTLDRGNRRTGMTVSGQPPVAYTHNRSGEITSIAQGGTNVTWARDGAARVTRITRPGVVADYSYDAASQLSGIVYTTPGGAGIGDLRYTYDPDRRIATVGGTLAQVGIPSTGPAVTYDKANRLVSRGGETLGYDADGNLTSDGTYTYSWNARGELTAVSGPGGTVSTGYDPLGGRRNTTVGGTTTSYQYDGPNLVQERTGGATADRLTAGLDQTLQRTDASGPRIPITDHLGTVLGLADSSGTLRTRYRYDPYGNVTSDGEANANTQQYTGREYDTTTGLLYNRARYYSPALGRFISQDPAGLGGGTTNLYNYANSNPTNLSDPSGQVPAALVALAALRQCAANAAAGLGMALVGRKLFADDEYRRSHASQQQKHHKGLDVFGFGSVTGHVPFGQIKLPRVPGLPVRVEGEVLSLAGYNTASGSYYGSILASGVAVGTHHNYVAKFDGIEYLNDEKEPVKIQIFEGVYGPEIPILGGLSCGGGVYKDSDGGSGAFFFIQGGVFGEHASLGIGVGW